MINVCAVVGARPNFMKIAPLMQAMSEYPDISAMLVHTGQHYDQQLSKLFFEDLRIPEPDIDLGIGSASHAVQTAQIMIAFEHIIVQKRPDVVVVVGDVNSTIGCALPAVKLGIPVAHVEAGLRSFDRSMPEEINRILTDAISEYLFVTEPAGRANLLREGIAAEKIHFVGNVMIDTLLAHKSRAEQSTVLRDFGLQQGAYALLTLHRPSNVDDRRTLLRIIEALEDIQRRHAIIFPVHPRTRRRMQEFDVLPRVQALPNLRMIEPLGYLDFLALMAHARFVLTDSGGIQEETTILSVPCITLRENTERPITIERGTNMLAGTDPQRIIAASVQVLDQDRPPHAMPELWDGRAAQRIVAILRAAMLDASPESNPADRPNP